MKDYVDTERDDERQKDTARQCDRLAALANGSVAGLCCPIAHTLAAPAAKEHQSARDRSHQHELLAERIEGPVVEVHRAHLVGDVSLRNGSMVDGIAIG